MYVFAIYHCFLILFLSVVICVDFLGTHMACLVLFFKTGCDNGGHSNRCQNAADFQIHLCHLLATSREITSKFSLGESTPIHLAKYFYLSLYLYYVRILKYINSEKPNKDFVLIYIYIFCLVCLINK